MGQKGQSIPRESIRRIPEAKNLQCARVGVLMVGATAIDLVSNQDCCFPLLTRGWPLNLLSGSALSFWGRPRADLTCRPSPDNCHVPLKRPRAGTVATGALASCWQPPLPSLESTRRIPEAKNLPTHGLVPDGGRDRHGFSL